MPFNFPITPNRSGEIFANAMQQALGNYYQGKAFQRQKQFDTRALTQQDQGQALQRAEAARQGIHFDEPGQPVPSTLTAPRISIPLSTAVNDNGFQQTMSAAMRGQSPRIAQPPTPNERADNGDFQLPDFTFFKGGYINNREGMIPMLLNATMKAREAGMVKGAEKNAEEPYAETAFQRSLSGDRYKSDLEVQRGRTQAQDRATALTGATLPGGATISPQQAAAVAYNPGTAGSIFRPSANVPLTPEWFKAKQAESDIQKQKEMDMLGPRADEDVKKWRTRMADPLSQLNKDEGAVLQHLPLAASAYNVIAKYGAPGAWEQFMANHGGSAGNALNSEEGQEIMRAIRQFATSGAIASEGVRGTAERTRLAFMNAYTPQAFDKPGTVKAVLGQMQSMLQSAKAKGGQRVWQRFEPDQQAQIQQALAPKNPYR